MSNSSRIPNQNLSAARPETRSAQHRVEHDHAHKHGPECDHDHGEAQEEKRGLGSMLATGLVGQAKAAATSKVSNALKMYLISFITPIKSLIATAELIPGAGMAIKTVETWLASNLQGYVDNRKINLGMDVHQAIDKLLHGDSDQFSDDFVNAMADFVQNAIPQKITDAFKSGNPLTIASALTSTVSENASSIASQMNNPEIQGNFITRPLKYIASFIPYVSKAPEWLKPVIGGGVAYMGLGFVWRMTKGLFKWIVGGAALYFGYRFFMGKKVDPDQKAQVASATKNPPGNTKSYAVPA